MECEKDISTYRRLQSETRLFQLLAGVSERYEPERRDILKMDPLPNVEAAYALLWRGAARRGIWGTETGGNADREIGSGLVTHTSHHDDEAVGMAAKGFRLANRSGPPKGSGGTSSREKVDKNQLKCSHCGMKKHTKETCFRLVGYPEWWEDNHKPPKENHGRAAAAVSDSEVANHRNGGNGESRRDGGEEVGRMAMVARASSGGAEELNGGMDFEGYQDGGDHWAWH